MNSRASRRAPARSSRANARHERRNSSAKRRLKIGLVVAGIVVLGSVTWLATRALVVKTDLEASQSLVSQLQANATSGDFEAMSATGAELEARSSSAVNGTHDLTWRIAEFIPVLGENLTGVRVVAESIDSIVQEVAAPAVKIASTFDISARDPESGGFDLSPLSEAEAIVASAQDIFATSLTQLAAVDTSITVGPVTDAVDKLDGLLTTASEVVDGAAPLLKVAGTALGQDGPRTYVMAFQNNAESTALGGSAASFSVISADRGAIAITDQASSADFKNRDAVDVPVDQSALDLYTDYLVTHSNTATSRPDFPTAGAILQAYWQRDRGVAVDGVISVDPIALSYMLKATGPLTLSTGDVLSSDNAVDLLLNEVYFRWDSYAEPEKVDAFFSEAASAILTKVLSGDFDMAEMAAAVTKGVNQGSIMAWFANPDEQALLDGTRLQGTMPKDNADATVMGIFYRDTSASKIDYYLKTATTTSSDICTVPDNPTFTSSATLTSNLTNAQQAGLPDYVKSNTLGDVFRTEVFVYGPVGATLTSATIDVEGELTEVNASAVDLGRPVAKFTVYLAPGDTSTVTASFQGAPGEYGKLEVRGTPMINATPKTITEGADCG
ncbi:DUF4012 domain-containing protein [Cryobacterium sp. SO2]|uniref:DUF4012 domain-containing protein n=1 Tax=Cryobacterium sp. SO2 TaxID=1897060 RepID=UPI00223CB609|nr:DUF4012 domain-containing protein [Cryobacterium sp. SO2]WEO76768.1 DUF4012 domain-containing protein [Cryobacterium sp. SO2]